MAIGDSGTLINDITRVLQEHSQAGTTELFADFIVASLRSLNERYKESIDETIVVHEAQKHADVFRINRGANGVLIALVGPPSVASDRSRPEDPPAKTSH